MTFLSVEFILFFCVLFFVYHLFLPQRPQLQNLFILSASYIFYAWADWQILILLIFSTLVFYGLGIAVHQTENEKRKNLFTILGMVFGIGMLVYFKYLNFFIGSFNTLFENAGLQTNWQTLQLILPLGISFYTFRLLSYLIEINRKKCEPTRNLITFSTYVAFFPGILSGPIDRPNTFIPQLEKQRSFQYSLAADGLKQILWGAFKKIVIADNLAVYVQDVQDTYTMQNGSTLVMAAALYTLQLYADFSGYTDMATGLGKLMGFQMTRNFNSPLIAQNMADFWRRWHISLTSWLTDYLFMPLNIQWRARAKGGMSLAIMVTFVVCGLWHGAQWTFVFWGFYMGLLFIPLIFRGIVFKNAKMETHAFGIPKPVILAKMLLTFSLVTFGLIFFQSESITQAFGYISHIFTTSLFTRPRLEIGMGLYAYLLLSFILVAADWFGREQAYAIARIGILWKPMYRYMLYYAMLLAIILLAEKQSQFIYVQF